MGFLSRLLVPRSVRRAVHPVRAVKRAATPKVVKKATRAMHPLDSAVYGAERFELDMSKQLDLGPAPAPSPEL